MTDRADLVVVGEVGGRGRHEQLALGDTPHIAARLQSLAAPNCVVIGEGTRDGVGAVLAPAVVLATGGIGQVFVSTTNPREATGDGSAAALRAVEIGADGADFLAVDANVGGVVVGGG